MRTGRRDDALAIYLGGNRFLMLRQPVGEYYPSPSFSESQMCSVGANALRVVEVRRARPHRRAVAPPGKQPGAADRAEHPLHRCRRDSPPSRLHHSVPWSNRARAKKGEPIDFWQLRQWQIRTLSRLALALEANRAARGSRLLPPSDTGSWPLYALIRRAAAGDVEHRAGGEGAVFRHHPGDHRGQFLDQHETVLSESSTA